METQLWKVSSRSLAACVLFLLVLVVLVCNVAGSNDVGAQEFDVAASHEVRPTSLDYEIGVPVCGQTRNLVPNAGFEAGIGVEHGWMASGPCSFNIGPGRDSLVSAQILAQGSTNKSCMLLSLIDQIPVEADRTYDYSAWISATLEQGTAYLATTFWRIHNNTWKQVGEPVLTNQVASTLGDWVQVTGSARAPAEAEYARVEPTLAAYSAGVAWFDDVDLSLSTCLVISKEDDPDEVSPGGVLTYTIVYSNTGRGAATDCWVAEDYDEDVDLIQSRTVPPPDIGDHTWLLADLGPGERGVITAVVQVQPEVKDRLLYNVVEILCSETLEPISANLITPILPTDTCAIDLMISEGEKVGRPSQTVSHDLTLRNIGECGGPCALAASSSSGWPIELDPAVCTLPIGGAQPVTLSLHIPEDVSVGTCVTTVVTATLECEPPCSHTAMDSETFRTCTVSSAFLPLLMKDFHGSRWECSPNNTCQEACPLLPGIEYYGYLDDVYDSYGVDFPSPGGRLFVEFYVDPGSGLEGGVQIWIVNKANVLGCWDNTPEDGFHLDCPVESGWHCLVVYAADPLHSYLTPYVIVVDFLE